MRLQATLSDLHRRVFVDMVILGCILFFWILLAEVTSMAVTADPSGLISWAEVPTFAFLLAATVNAVIYIGARFMALADQSASVTSS